MELNIIGPFGERIIHTVIPDPQSSWEWHYGQGIISCLQAVCQIA